MTSWVKVSTPTPWSSVLKDHYPVEGPPKLGVGPTGRESWDWAQVIQPEQIPAFCSTRCQKWKVHYIYRSTYSPQRRNISHAAHAASQDFALKMAFMKAWASSFHVSKWKTPGSGRSVLLGSWINDTPINACQNKMVYLTVRVKRRPILSISPKLISVPCHYTGSVPFHCMSFFLNVNEQKSSQETSAQQEHASRVSSECYSNGVTASVSRWHLGTSTLSKTTFAWDTEATLNF